jgi:hypothetical protein
MRRQRTFVPYDIAVMLTVVATLPLISGFWGYRDWEWIPYLLGPLVVIWGAALIGGHRSGVSFRDYVASLRRTDPSALDERRRPR